LTEVFEVRDNRDWTYTVNYTPSMEGLHSLMVKYTEDASFSRYEHCVYRYEIL